MAVATYTDVETALGRTLTEAEQAQVEWWLSGFELFIINRLGPVAELDADVVTYVEVEAAIAKLNRAGRTESSITVSVDDGTITRRYENASAGDITDEWWNLLDPDASRAAASIRPGFDADDTAWSVATPGLPGSIPDEFGWYVR